MFLGPIAHQWRTLRLSAAGDVVRVYLDGAELITFVDDAPLPTGQVTIGGRRSRESRFAIDDLSLWAAEGEAGMSAAAAFAAPLALAAPMAFGSASASAAGRMPSTLAWSDAFGYDSNDLTLATPDGTLTAYPGLELAARQPWSPDGQWLLVRMNGDDSLGILNPQTGETRMLTTLPALDDGMRDECPAWSPDGTQVVFLSRRRDGPVLLPTPSGGTWTWYPPALYAVAADGQTAPRRVALSSGPDNNLLGCPQWSAVGNGQQIISLSYQDIYAVDALTGSIVTLYHDDYGLAYELQDPFMLSPDGTKVAFGQIVAPINVPSNVSVLDLQSGEVITAAEEKFSDGDLSYFNHWALYTSWDWDDTGTRLAIGRDRMAESPAGYNRDIVISDLAQPCPSCAVVSVPNSQRTVYVQSAIPNQAGVTWSPDGRWIAAVDTLPWDPETGGNALAQLVVLDPVCAERLTVTEPQVWANTYNGWGGIALIAWQPLPAGSGGMMAFGTGDEYCVPVTPTPTLTPTYIPRTVEPPAQSLHSAAGRFGIPAPFSLWPVAGTDLFQNGYGPNWFSQSRYAECDLPRVPASVATPFAGTPTPIPDPCPYRGTNNIHPGTDYFTDPENSIVVALCDGIIVPGRREPSQDRYGRYGGSAAGWGLTLRCFADDPNDPDGDGLRNLSNIVVVYNHLRIDQNVASDEFPPTDGAYQIVYAGQPLATTDSSGTPDSHLDLQIYIASGHRADNAVQLNPRFMNRAQSRVDTIGTLRTESEQVPYPVPYDNWSLQGRLEGAGFGAIDFWTQSSVHVFLYDVAGYLDARYPIGTRYEGPNCDNLPAELNISESWWSSPGRIEECNVSEGLGDT